MDAIDRFVSLLAVAAQLVWRAFSVHASRWPDVTACGRARLQPRKAPRPRYLTVHDAATITSTYTNDARAIRFRLLTCTLRLVLQSFGGPISAPVHGCNRCYI
jgi:hypothetical protein